MTFDQTLDARPSIIPAARGGHLASLANCVAEIHASIRSAFQADIYLDVRLIPGLPDLACDPLDLQSALLNLVFNAREAMAGHGLIRLHAARSVDDPLMAELQVVDSGVGMSPDTIARALDPFFTTKSDGLGGIGLPMVERFVRECGGAVFIESALGVGTTVILRLPFAPPGSDSSSQSPEFITAQHKELDR